MQFNKGKSIENHPPTHTHTLPTGVWTITAVIQSLDCGAMSRWAWGSAKQLELLLATNLLVFVQMRLVWAGQHSEVILCRPSFPINSSEFSGKLLP